MDTGRFPDENDSIWQGVHNYCCFANFQSILNLLCDCEMSMNEIKSYFTDFELKDIVKRRFHQRNLR